MLSSVASCIIIKPIGTLSIKSDSCDRPIVLWLNVSEKQVLSCCCLIKCCDTSVQSGPVTSNYPLSKRLALGVSQGGEWRWHNDIFRGSLFGTSHSTEERAQSSGRLRKHYSMERTGLRGSHPKVGKNLRKVWKYLDLEIPKNVYTDKSI